MKIQHFPTVSLFKSELKAWGKAQLIEIPTVHA